MSKFNPLLGLLSSYGDSDEDSEDEVLPIASKVIAVTIGQSLAPTLDVSTVHAAGIHPAPIPHCQWSACYDESSGCTYYWNQQTNAVTWDAPPEYLLALKVAQQQLHSSGSTEVSAEEWQLYQQALVEKQNASKKVLSKQVAIKPAKNIEKAGLGAKQKNGNKKPVKRKNSSDEEEKIELITSYHNSDSESNDEPDTPAKPVEVAKPVLKPKNLHKKQKTKPQVLEYGPRLPSDQKYVVPIGPEIPPSLVTEDKPSEPNKSSDLEKENDVAESIKEVKSTAANDAEDIQDDDDLLKKLKDKAKLLEKLGGEIPSELQKIIEEETSRTASPVKSIEENSRDSKVTTEANIDDLLDEIEKKEFPKLVKSQEKRSIDMFDDEDTKKYNGNSTTDSPKSSGSRTPPLEELKALFPNSKTVDDKIPKTLFPSAVNIPENEIEVETKPGTPPIVEVSEKKGANIYIMDVSEPRENTTKKKRRIDNTVLPDRKVNEAPAYTTKYSQYIEGFTGERTGLGFSKDDANESVSQKETISYGNGLTFTKGETLNEEKKDEALDDLTDLVEAKLKFLCQQQLCSITPVQEMLIQMQTLGSAFRAGSLAATYWRRWTEAAHVSLSQHEAIAAPPGWTCTFHRSEGRYRYVREVDGLAQWEYPAVTNTDMEICTTPPPPPPPPSEQPVKSEDPPAPPLPPLPAATPPPPPPPVWSRVSTPPPPTWADPPPPGTDDRSHTPPEPKKEIGDELMSFYNDLAELEKHTSEPAAASNSPEAADIPKFKEEKASLKIKVEEKSSKIKEETSIKEEKEKGQVKDVKAKKKSKVKITSSIGMKQKTVTSLVAKWQQVAEEIDSD